jgi:hypothetical protein
MAGRLFKGMDHLQGNGSKTARVFEKHEQNARKMLRYNGLEHFHDQASMLQGAAH